MQVKRRWCHSINRYKTSIEQYYRSSRLPHVQNKKNVPTLRRARGIGQAEIRQKDTFATLVGGIGRIGSDFHIAFLTWFKGACDSIGVHEVVAMWTYPRLMNKTSSSSLSTRYFSKKAKSSGFHDEGLSSYVHAVNFLLAIYATDGAIVWAVKSQESYILLACMAPTEFAKNLYIKALWGGVVYDEKNVKPSFVEGLKNAVCYSVLLYCSPNPSEPLTQSARYADTVTNSPTVLAPFWALHIFLVEIR